MDLSVDPSATGRRDVKEPRIARPRISHVPYRWFRTRPGRVQAWRVENELPARDLMRRRQLI